MSSTLKDPRLDDMIAKISEMSSEGKVTELSVLSRMIGTAINCAGKPSGKGTGKVDAHPGKASSGSVRIGGQVWMSHNLQMPADPENGIYVVNGETYFTWEAAVRVAKSYGNGWRLPSREDWTKLADACGASSAGSHLKSTSGWNGENGVALPFSSTLSTILSSFN